MPGSPASIRPSRHLLWWATLVAMLVAACGSGGSIPDQSFPVVANAEVAQGPQRLLVGLVTTEGASLASPDLEVSVELSSPSGGDPTTQPATFLWTVPDVRGLYRVEADLTEPGTWQIALVASDGSSTPRIPFTVLAEGRVPAVGQRAPAVTTRTAADVADLGEITTDTDPDPRFYQLSLDEALESGRPTVVVFATPAFCQTATCGPMLDTVKEVAADHTGIDFVHVEVYENLDADSPSELQLVKAVEVWRLPSEPWVFVVSGDGVITARFEGALDISELRAALEALG